MIAGLDLFWEESNLLKSCVNFLRKLIFRENIDEMFPIAFDISDEDVRTRFPEEAKKRSYEQRLTEFNRSADNLKLV